ncbi:putative type III secretion chaperone SycD/LcrH [Candidatus Protochlamydia naegleriophila]|uniref:Putative type III secretion chaperone SycD/LcrH n=1 Tax=Candidatus Protochlamydia naegleriophila TaxID=389348 RepID=A0A0U5JDT8_9BACT|nr:SycD/LcrH family type III secretion system chaperone [Candidatus Protochlamydia naegleriophila]CUI17678.1 putative type III secretion chaperone SycD/LcrH [Candidatus Protochlamydia naegleriophila]
MARKKALSGGQDKQSVLQRERFESIKQQLILYLLEQGIISRESLHLDEENAKKLYERAYQLYSAGKYREAKGLFAILLLLDSTDYNFIYGMATCCLMLKEYGEAARGYIQCGIVDAQNPMPYFYAADCYLHNNDWISACVALRIVIKRAQGKPEYVEITHRTQLTLDALAPSTNKSSKPGVARTS